MSQVAGTLLRLLPGWLAGQKAGEWDARRRRLDPAAAGRPDRRAATGRWGLSSAAGRTACHRSPDRGRAPARHRATSCRSPAPRSSPASSSPGCSQRARRRVVEPLPDPRPHRANAGRGRAPRLYRAGDAGGVVATSRNRVASLAERSDRGAPATSPRRPSRSSPGVLVPGSEVGSATSASIPRVPAYWRSLTGCAPESRPGEAGAGGWRAGRRPSRPARPS